MLESIIDKTRIVFPKPIDKDEVRIMLTCLARSGNYVFNLSQSGYLNVRYTEGDMCVEDYVSNLGGMIARNEPFGITNVSFIQDEVATSIFKEIRFLTVPGYEWEELNPSEVTLIEDLKKDISNYLATH